MSKFVTVSAHVNTLILLFGFRSLFFNGKIVAIVVIITFRLEKNHSRQAPSGNSKVGITTKNSMLFK